MLEIRIPTIVVNATSYSPSMVSLTCRPITCVTAHLSLHRGDGYCINYHDIPSHKKKEICHTMVVCEVRPEKDDPNHIQITIGGNCICYPGNVGTNTALLELLKLLVNSVLSWKGACFSSTNLKNFYLDTPMTVLGFVRLRSISQVAMYDIASSDVRSRK